MFESRENGWNKENNAQNNNRGYAMEGHKVPIISEEVNILEPKKKLAIRL